MYDDNQIRTCPNNFKFTVCLKVVDTPVLPMLAVSPELPHNQRLQEAPGAAEKLGCLPAWSDRQQKSDSEETEDTEKKDERWWKSVKSNKGYIYIQYGYISFLFSFDMCLVCVMCGDCFLSWLSSLGNLASTVWPRNSGERLAHKSRYVLCFSKKLEMPGVDQSVNTQLMRWL